MNAAPALAVERLQVSLGRRPILVDIAFSLPCGCLAAIVGPNGAGKTTLLKAIAGLVPADGGISAGGEPVHALNVRERAKRLAYLPQGHVVHWPLPVRDIVALGRFPHGARDPSRLSPGDGAAVASAMRAAGVADLADRNVAHLSGGERSRVALARVLAVEAPIILADEPTASLDPRYQIEVMTILHSIAQAGTLVIAVTHDLGLAARFADLVLVLDRGALAAIGEPSQALAPAIMADVFRIAAYRAMHEGQPIVVPWSLI